MDVECQQLTPLLLPPPHLVPLPKDHVVLLVIPLVSFIRTPRTTKLVWGLVSEPWILGIRLKIPPLVQKAAAQQVAAAIAVVHRSTLNRFQAVRLHRTRVLFTSQTGPGLSHPSLRRHHHHHHLGSQPQYLDSHLPVDLDQFGKQCRSCYSPHLLQFKFRCLHFHFCLTVCLTS